MLEVTHDTQRIWRNQGTSNKQNLSHHGNSEPKLTF